MQTKLIEQALPRKGTVYIAVTGTALLVSLIGLAAMHMARLEIRKTTALNNQAYARHLAQSGAEVALAIIAKDPTTWRSAHEHGVEVIMTPDGMDEAICYRLLDYETSEANDGELDDDDTDLVEIQGIGKVINRTITNVDVQKKNTTTFVYSVICAPKIKLDNYIGPEELMSFVGVSGGNESTQSINENTWSGQYFVPELPSDAVEWLVTSVDVYVRRDGTSNAELLVKIYEPDGSGLPAAEIDASSIKSENLTNAFEWFAVNIANVSRQPVGSGLCLCLEGASAESVDIQYEGAGVVQTNSQLLTASGGSWATSGTDKSLWYRVHGIYTTETGDEEEFAISPGTWKAIPAN